MEETHVVTAFLRNRGEVLLVRRSEAVGSYVGQWGAVAGHVEDDPDESVRREIREETGIEDATLVRRGEPFPVADDFLDTRWIVHPYLFEVSDRAVETNRETTEIAWVPPTEIRRRDTVPDLWTSYDRVAPTVEAVAGDREHGSAAISIRALEVLRDRAGVLAERDESGSDDAWADLARVAADLLAARPSMAVLANRVNRAMAEATDERTPAAVERAATAGIERAFAADEAAARRAGEMVAGERVLTLSRSGTVLDALRSADSAPSVLVAESRPAREGVGVAETLAGEGPDVTLCTDAAVAHLLAEESVESVLVGADAVLPDGGVVNKVGTRAAALAAAREEIPFHAVAATDKISTDTEPTFEDGDPAAVYDGEAAVAVVNPTFDLTPSDLVSGVITERGMLTAEEVAEIANEYAELADWNE